MARDGESPYVMALEEFDRVVRVPASGTEEVVTVVPPAAVSSVGWLVSGGGGGSTDGNLEAGDCD